LISSTRGIDEHDFLFPTLRPIRRPDKEEIIVVVEPPAQRTRESHQAVPGLAAGGRLACSHGGTHHGYFLPAEGASDQALALFSFPSLAAYEQYRTLFGTDPEFVAADRIRDESGCVLRYQRTFMRPLLPG
jgi:hypothetical protein